MIRTHRPRGYLWSCPSLFQETPLFRDINIIDCAALSDEDTTSRAGDGFLLASRAAKRQRLGQLANDFLNGLELEIPSVNMVPCEVRLAVASTFETANQGRKALEEFETDSKTTGLEEPVDYWNDVRSHEETLQDYLSAQSIHAGDKNLQETRVAVTEDQAQASCKSAKRLQSAAPVTFGSNDNAMTRTGRLRDRRLREPSFEIPANIDPHSCARPYIPDSQMQALHSETRETASDCGSPPTPAWTASKLIKSGGFQLRKEAVNQCCSQDEQGASSMSPQSQRPCTPANSLARNHVAARVIFRSNSDAASTATSGTHNASAFAKAYSPHRIDTHQRPTNTKHTSDEGLQLRSQSRMIEHAVQMDDQTFEAHSVDPCQGQMIRQQYAQVEVRLSCATKSEDTQPPARSSKRLGANFESTVSISVPEAMSSGTPDGSRANPGINTPSQLPQRPERQQSSAPVSLKHSAKQITRSSAKQRQKMSSFIRQQHTAETVHDASPFLYCERALTSRKRECVEISSCKTPSTQQASKEISGKSVIAPVEVPQATKATTSHHSETGRLTAPNIPLVNAHLNTILPADGASGGQVSALRKSLIDELRASGAELSGYDEHSFSLVTYTADHTLSQSEKGKLPQLPSVSAECKTEYAWPGTHVLLVQAHQDLVTSPGRRSTAFDVDNRSTPCVRSTVQGQRCPLRPLPQESLAMPSTQALLDDWHGFSSIKKPRISNANAKTIQTPCIGKSVSDTTASGLTGSHESVDFRKSSVQFSMSCHESSELLQGEESPMQLAPGTAPS